MARVLFIATFSLLEQTAILALRFVCATNDRYDITNTFMPAGIFPGERLQLSPLYLNQLKWSSGLELDLEKFKVDRSPRRDPEARGFIRPSIAPTLARESHWNAVQGGRSRRCRTS